MIKHFLTSYQINKKWRQTKVELVNLKRRIRQANVPKSKKKQSATVDLEC